MSNIIKIYRYPHRSTSCLLFYPSSCEFAFFWQPSWSQCAERVGYIQTCTRNCVEIEQRVGKLYSLPRAITRHRAPFLLQVSNKKWGYLMNEWSITLKCWQRLFFHVNKSLLPWSIRDFGRFYCEALSTSWIAVHRKNLTSSPWSVRRGDPIGLEYSMYNTLTHGLTLILLWPKKRKALHKEMDSSVAPERERERERER